MMNITTTIGLYARMMGRFLAGSEPCNSSAAYSFLGPFATLYPLQHAKSAPGGSRLENRQSKAL